MGFISYIIIFICISMDNMVSANMTAMNLDAEKKSIFSIKTGLFFAGFNLIFFLFGYVLSMIFFRSWVYTAHNWVAFAFLLLLGIKFMLESIEKSPSFKSGETADTSKMLKMSSLEAASAFMVGYALEQMDTAFFLPAVCLTLIAFGMTLLGFHLGGPNSKSVISKKLELVGGIILIIMAIRLIIV